MLEQQVVSQPERKRTDLAHSLREECPENVFLCYQCLKCTAGCPVAHEMEVKPHQILRLLQFDRIEEALKANTAWVCSCCQTCNTRCPVQIDIARLMDSLKILAQRAGVAPKVPAVPIFIAAGLRGINYLGRMYELQTVTEVNLRTRRPFKDVGMGVKMLLSGKLHLFPQIARYPRLGEVPQAAPVEKAVAYYPGCSLHGTAAEYDLSLRAVAQKVGLALEEPKGWVCCGNSVAHWKSHLEGITWPLKSIALMEKSGHRTVSVPCAMCFLRLRYAVYEVERDPALKERVAREIGYTYKGGITVERALDTFVERVGLAGIARHMKKPLRDLKVVCYYGCYLTRPPQVTGSPDYEYPTGMDRLMRALGAQSLDWSYKTECCGGSHSITQTELSLTLIKRILENAREVGAEAVAVACPMCHANLDGRQRDIARHLGVDFRMPIFYFPQLIGLALGLGEKELALGRLLVDPEPLLRAKKLLG